MQIYEIIKLLGNSSTLITIILTFLLAVFGAVFSTLIEKQFRSNEKVLKKLFTSDEMVAKEDSVKQVITNIPDGLSEEDFFKRLKKELLEISYLQIKSPVKESSEESVYLLLEMHHQQALQQSKVQFWFSILASIIGFITIIISVFIFLNNNWYDYILKSIPGIVIEAVSFLFFNQARETRDRAAKFFKELNYEKQIAKSVAIADTIESEEIKSKVKSQIALRIIGINETE